MSTDTKPLFDFERVVIDHDSRDALSAIGLPPALPARFSAPAQPMRRSVVLARADGRLCGAALIVRRPVGAYVKIVGVWAAPGVERATVETELVAHVNAKAWAHGAVVVKRELDSHEPPRPACDDTDHMGVVRPDLSGPIPDPSDPVPFAELHWRTDTHIATVPYMRQTSDFTCGPACLLMALSHFGKHPSPDRASELALWREATLVDACGPYGMALAAHRHGLQVRLTVTTDSFVLMEDLESEQARDVSRFIQRGFRDAVQAAGIEVSIRQFDANDVRAVLDAGRLAILLVDQELFHAESCPHWLLVHAWLDGAFLIHDPWTEVAAGESWVDGYDLPLRPADLERVARFGQPPYGALLAVGR